MAEQVRKGVKGSWKTEIKETIEMWFSADNRLLTFFWIGCIVGICLLGVYTQNRATGFLGIADSRETIINFEYPVTVKHIHYLPGQLVNKGDLIAEVEQPDLASKIHIARASIEKLSAERNLKLELGRLAVSSVGRGLLLDRNMDPLNAEIRNLEMELRDLETRERNLYVFAEISGVIGSVNYKRGERASSFSPILTISPISPTYVQGFIHEAVHTQVQVGQKMTISSVADPRKAIDGRVVSVGSRIVEFPLRMERGQMKVYGREVAIELPKSEKPNPLLLGEKVSIQPAFSLISIPQAQAEGPEVLKTSKTVISEPGKITIPQRVSARSSFEPSGAMYWADLRKYAVVSDDTDTDGTPYVFLMDADGNIENELLKIENLAGIDDVESIFAGEGNTFYVLASQSLNKKGNEKKKRNLIVQVRREGLSLTATQTIELRPSLVKAIRSSTFEELKGLQSRVSAELEIEGAFVNAGQLVVALKGPLAKDGKSLLLSVGDVSKLMSAGAVDSKNLKVWKVIDFADEGKAETRISEILALDDHRFVIATFTHHPKVGKVWVYDTRKGTPVLLQSYPQLAPEGLGYGANKGEITVLFDRKDEDAMFAKLRVFEAP